MRASVAAAYYAVNKKFEGEVPWMYVDVVDLVTIGVGNKIDPVTDATRLPFYHAKNGATATVAEIAAAWTNIKTKPGLPKAGHLACEHENDLRLRSDTIQKLVYDQMVYNHSRLLAHIPDLDSWGADAQLGIHLWAYAMGPDRSDFPHLLISARAKDFQLCAHDCHISEVNNAGVHPRNVAMSHCFANAWGLKISGATDLDTLFYQVPS